MNPIIKKTLWLGYLFTLSPILLSFPIAFATNDYVSANFNQQLDLGLLGHDFFWTTLTFATMTELGIIGFIVLLVALSGFLVEEIWQLYFSPQTTTILKS